MQCVCHGMSCTVIMSHDGKIVLHNLKYKCESFFPHIVCQYKALLANQKCGLSIFRKLRKGISQLRSKESYQRNSFFVQLCTPMALNNFLKLNIFTCRNYRLRQL